MTSEQYEALPHRFRVSAEATGDIDIQLGQTAMYTVTITNQGFISNTYDLTAQSGLGWADFSGIPPAITLAPDASAVFSITVAVPSSALALAEDAVTIQARSQTARGYFDDAVTSIHVPSPSNTPTATPTALPLPTNTPTATPTNTPLPTVPPTNTPTPTATATPTSTPTAIPTSTATPSSTPTSTATATSTTTPTALPSSTPTSTPIPPGAADTIVVRHAPTLNGNARVEGTLRQLTGENLTMNGGAVVTGDLLLPGSPTIRQNGQPSLGATVAGSGSAQPTGYQLTLNGGVQIGRLVTRTDPLAMPTVAAPPQPVGTRTVTLNSAGQSLGDPATLRNLTLNSNVGVVAVPPGTYGQFTANSGAFLSFGIAGATAPAVYNLQGLTLNGQSALRVVGPVVINLAGGVTINGHLGASDHPLWLVLNVASGNVTLNGGSAFYGRLRAPSSTVTLNGNTRLRGAVVADRLTLNGGAVVQPGPTP